MTSQADRNFGTAADTSPKDAGLQQQSRDITKRLVEIFGDADQTNIRMQESKFHPEVGKFSNVKDEETREKLREAGLLLG